MISILLSFLVHIIPSSSEREIKVTELSRETASIVVGMNCFSYKEDYFILGVDAKFMVDYMANACCDYVQETDAYYLHNLLVLVTESGDPPEYKLYRVGPFFQPWWDGFEPKKEFKDDQYMGLNIKHLDAQRNVKATRVWVNLKDGFIETE